MLLKRLPLGYLIISLPDLNKGSAEIEQITLKLYLHLMSLVSFPLEANVKGPGHMPSYRRVASEWMLLWGEREMEKNVSYFCTHLWMVFHSNDVFDKFHGAYFFCK